MLFEVYMMRILVKSYIIIFFAALSITVAQEDLPKAAILYFKGEGLAPEQTQSLFDRFSMAVDSTKMVKLIAQRKVVSLLEEKGLNVSDCTTDSCAVRIGTDLDVSYVIAATVINMEGNTHNIAAKLLGVGVYNVKREKNIIHSGTLFELYAQTEILAWKLFDLEVPYALRMKVGDVYGGVSGKGLFGLKGLPTWMTNLNPYWCGLGLVAVGGAAIIIGGSDGGSDGTSPVGEPPDFPEGP